MKGTAQVSGQHPGKPSKLEGGDDKVIEIDQAEFKAPLDQFQEQQIGGTIAKSHKVDEARLSTFNELIGDFPARVSRTSTVQKSNTLDYYATDGPDEIVQLNKAKQPYNDMRGSVNKQSDDENREF